jgi:DNA-binding SARP family transcriptional activator/tRNA A-37 threonylcarbamoyl transferase component Bud32
MHGVPGAPVVRFAAMEFQILGPLQVFDDARPLALGGPKQRAVLAHLILRANHTVGADQLVDGLWGDEPPETARNTLQTYVYRLRKILGEERLERRDGGYILTAAPEEVDAARFEAIVRDAKRLSASDPAAAAARFGDALTLWRGAPLDDLGDEPSLRGEIARLEELHLSATEHRIAAEIASGRNSTVVSELEALTARYPLRERMWANLMLALNRGGRHAEALSTYQRAREVLIEELGTEPSTELQRMHERILQRDPSLGAQETPRQAVRPSRVDLPPGTEFAGYRIERTLGRGGMSVVYLAEHEWLQRKVALKVLAPQLAEDERFRERFVRESRLAASLDHPNVIPIYEAGASGGDLFIAMRYVEGTDLRTLLQEEGTLDPTRTIAIVRRIAAALDVAHEQGLVHRDVKPANVLLARPRGADAHEHVYLSDFGLTKRSVSDSGITGTGQFVGTLDYAAPEQFKGGAPDARTDVYSLACVLYECLAGHPPFSSDSDAGLMYAHLQQRPPSITQERPGLPKEIDRVIARAMAKEPPHRQQSAGSLVDEASRALGFDADGGGAAHSQRQTRIRAVAALAGVVVALVTGVVASTLFRGERPPVAGSQPTGAVASPSPTIAPSFRTVDRALTDDEERLLAFIPQDVRQACSSLDQAEPAREELAALVCRPAEVEVLYELFATRAAMDAAFQAGANRFQAPDGECATDRLAVTPYTIDDQPTGRVLCYTIDAGFRDDPGEGPSRSHIEWTDENALVYAHAVRNDLGDLSLYEWWLTSAGPAVSSGDGTSPLEKDRPSGLAGFLRDGTYLISYEGHVATGRETNLIRLLDGTYEYGIDGDVPERGTTYFQKPNTIVFAPVQCPGKTSPRVLDPAVYAWTVMGDSVSWDKLRGGPCAGPQPRFLPSRPWTRAPEGVIAVEIGGEIELVDPGGSLILSTTRDHPGPTPYQGILTASGSSPDWSPDGSKIVFAGADQTGLDLYVMSADGTDLHKITDARGDEDWPAWSPDGSRIVFGFDDGAESGWRSGLASVDPDGAGWTDLYVQTERRVGLPAWSPDGSRIAFTIDDEPPSSPFPFVIDADGGSLTKLRDGHGVALSWTPDGRRVVLSADGSFVTVRPNGSDERVFIEDPPEDGRLVIDWSPDGRWIAMSSPGGLGNNLYLMRADGSQTFLIGLGIEPSWRPTGD